MPDKIAYINRMMEDCKQARTILHKREVVDTVASAFDGVRNAVYVIEEIDGDAEQTYANFLSFKQERSRKCPKPNSPNKILYVGSSRANLKTRLRQHIGDISDHDRYASTYALHLGHWFDGRYLITAKTYDASPSVLQIIEDSWSHEIRPAFGKQGGNGR